MAKELQQKWDDPEESERFLAEAKAAEASDDPKALERAVKTVVRRSRN